MRLAKIIILVSYFIMALLLWNRIHGHIFISYMVRSIIAFPFCAFITLALHELTHFLVFKLLGAQVTGIKISIFEMDFQHDPVHLVISSGSFFSGYCTISMPELGKRRKIIIGLFAGGASGIVESILALLLFLLKFPDCNWLPFWSCLLAVGIYSFYVTLMKKNSADRLAIKNLSEEKCVS